MSASTKNAPVYNVIQSSFQTNTNDFKELPTMEISKYKICSSNDEGQSTMTHIIEVFNNFSTRSCLENLWELINFPIALTIKTKENSKNYE